MQRVGRRNMVEIVKFTYVMIILISLFLFSTNVDALRIRCNRVSDCPKQMYCNRDYELSCVYNQCKCVRIT
ncbi:putative Late nodulin [Medicago truncatula]|uniref:Putative Late nodulin n=1 Tax=Medicago truncatula TaxID=3880 RepID=A0A396IRP3_MEDTR|nr:putative Late nodulin [Medicago truncatula]